MEDDLPDYLQSEKVPTTVITLVAEENVESMDASLTYFEARNLANELTFCLEQVHLRSMKLLTQFTSTVSLPSR